MRHDRTDASLGDVPPPAHNHDRGHGDPGTQEEPHVDQAADHHGTQPHDIGETGDAQQGHGHQGHGHQGHGDHAAAFRDRFWWSLVLAIPVIVFSHMFADLLGYDRPAGTDWVSPALGSVVYVYGGWPFLSGAVTEIRARQPGMMLLVSLAITVSFGASITTSLHIADVDLDFWWELALLIVIMLLGHWLEMRALGRASSALDALAALLPDRAERLDEHGTAHPVDLLELAVGDLVLVRPGGRVPADGVITAGQAAIDESMITGESRPVGRSAGERVVAGSVATDSAIRVRVDAVGDQTALAGIRRLVEQAQTSNSRAQALADRAAAWLFYVAITAGFATFLVWLAVGNASDAVERTVTVLVIACPHALGLAIPLVIAISTAVAARAGILVTDRIALERTRTIDTVLFDKTGTLTRGQPTVTDVISDDDARDRLLLLTGAAEADSEHPLAKAIVAAAMDIGPLPAAREFQPVPGRGVQAVVEGRTIAVGGPALLRDTGTEPSERVAEAGGPGAPRGATVLYVVSDGTVRGALALADEIRPTAREAVEGLHRRGIQVIMITGDAGAVAATVAAELGIDEVFAEVLPADKDTRVAELQARGHRVAMVGDGVNDAPALARADVGVAIGAGTDVAISSAGVVLASDDPRGVLGVIDLSKASYRKMIQNLAWATGYNLIAIPLAAGVLAPIGILLPPAVGAILMSVSTIVVAANAQLLRRLNPQASLSPQDRSEPARVVHARGPNRGTGTRLEIDVDFDKRPR